MPSPIIGTKCAIQKAIPKEKKITIFWSVSMRKNLQSGNFYLKKLMLNSFGDLRLVEIQN